jgi:hypothetical protein
MTRSQPLLCVGVAPPADKDQPEGIVLHVIDDPVFADIIPQKRVSLQSLGVVGPGVIEQGKRFAQRLPELPGLP